MARPPRLPQRSSVTLPSRPRAALHHLADLPLLPRGRRQSRGAGNAYVDANIKVNELLYRRVDIEDVVSAHLTALRRGRSIGFGRYIISATTPFARGDLAELRSDAPLVVRRFSRIEDIYARRDWRLFPSIERVYVNTHARATSDGHPATTSGMPGLPPGRHRPEKPLAVEIGAKGYRHLYLSVHAGLIQSRRPDFETFGVDGRRSITREYCSPAAQPGSA